MSRKIEDEMINAIEAWKLGTRTKPWSNGNTAIRLDGDFMSVYLHGHLIAREMADATWKFNLCGFNTPTTRSRINALAREFGRSGVRSVGGCPLMDTRTEDDGKRLWIEVPIADWF